MIRGIIFDCFGVLYGGSLSALLDMCPPERRIELRDLNKQSDYGFISGDDYVEGLSRVLDKPRSEIENILHAKHIRNQALIDYTQSLRPQYKIGLLSNVSSGTMDYLFPSEQRAELFDAVVLSYEENLAKPNPAVFELMAQRLGLAPGECVMVDDLAENCEGAEVAGMESIQHVRNDLTEQQLAEILARDGDI